MLSKTDFMKRLFYSIFLLIILCPAKLQAQGGQPLDMLIASTADALVDSMYSFNHIRSKDVKFGHLYDTAMYIQTGSGFSNETVKYMIHKLNAVSTEKNGYMTIYTYQNDSDQMWKISKKIKLDKKMNILGRPRVEFLHDTVSVTVGSQYLSWEKLRRRMRWGIAVSDWVTCKYIYSKTEERWVMVESDFGGI